MGGSVGRSHFQAPCQPAPKHQYSLGKTDLRRGAVAPVPVFRIFHSLTRSSTQMRPSKQLLVLKNSCIHWIGAHTIIGGHSMSNCLQCRTTCNVELLAVSACNVELLAMSNSLQCRTTCSVCLQCRTACNVEPLAISNCLQC